jgi:hypothetical protein
VSVSNDEPEKGAEQVDEKRREGRVLAFNLISKGHVDPLRRANEPTDKKEKEEGEEE